MTTLLPYHMDMLPWYLFGAYYARTAVGVKSTKATEKSADRLITVVVMVVASLFCSRNGRAPARCACASSLLTGGWHG